MSATTTSTAIELPSGLGRRVTLVAARVFAPGIMATLLVQHVVVLPPALAPVAAFLGLHVGA